MGLPKFLQPYLASYDLSQLDVEQDKELIMMEILNKGDDKAMVWLAKTYSRAEMRQVVKQPRRGMWFERALNYWCKILGVSIPKPVYKRALFNLNPGRYVPEDFK